MLQKRTQMLMRNTVNIGKKICALIGTMLKAVLPVRTTVTAVHCSEEFLLNIAKGVARIFLSVNRTSFVPPAEQLAYIKHEKNMQYFKEKKKKSADGTAIPTTDKEKISIK